MHALAFDVVDQQLLWDALPSLSGARDQLDEQEVLAGTVPIHHVA